MGEDGSARKLLIVDDEEDMVWTLQKNLANSGLGVQVLIARSGEDAITVLKHTRVDLILTDIRMPGISGLDLLMHVRQNYPHTGVIVMTAYPSPQFKKDAACKGCLHFVEKPFDINNLRNLVQEALKRDEGFQGTVAGIELTDIIQLNCLSRTTAALRVKALAREGIIYFKDGGVVHAICGEAEGEQAFYEIVAFEGGTLESLKGAEAPAVSIRIGHEALLMEAMRRVDEARKESGGVSAEEQNALSLQDIVSTFLSIDGVATAYITDTGGVILEGTTPVNSDGDVIGSLTSGAWVALQSLVRKLTERFPDFAILESEDGTIIVAPLAGEHCIVIRAAEEADMIRLMTEVKKLKNVSSVRVQG